MSSMLPFAPVTHLYHLLNFMTTLLIMRFFFNEKSVNNNHSSPLPTMSLTLMVNPNDPCLLSPYGVSYSASHGQSSVPSNPPRCGSSSSPFLICQYYDKRGHTAKTCYFLHGYPPNHPRYQAKLTTKDSSPKPTWLFNSRASHHVIHDLPNLSLTDNYTGYDQIVVANGKGLPITHIGSTQLPTSSTVPHLTNVLYAPNISQNLIFVSQLC